MDKKWYNKLIEVLNVQTNSVNEKLMVLFLDKELRSLGLDYGIDAVGNMLVIKGKATTYPCVVSHMDTVHDFVTDFEIINEYYTYRNKKTKEVTREDIELTAYSGNTQVGIGGDDKCGVFACLYFLETLPAIKVVFFSREESGCSGSIGVNKTFFDDCRYIIQLDRRGKKDLICKYWGDNTISTNLSSEIGLIKKKYKFKNAIGTITDCMKLWSNNIGISCMNISSGYYSPHSNTEYVSTGDLWNSIKFVEEMINTLKAKRYKSLPKKVVYTQTKYVSTYEQCDKCFGWKLKALLYKKGTGYICHECKTKKSSTKTTTKKDDDYSCYRCNKVIVNGKGEILLYRNGHFYCNKCCKSIDKELDKNNESPFKYYCSTCMEILEEKETTVDSCGRLSEDAQRCCKTCDTIVQDYNDVLHT